MAVFQHKYKTSKPSVVLFSRIELSTLYCDARWFRKRG